MDGRFQDRICVVTGASSGIGRSTVQRFAPEGGTVVTADLDLPEARETVRLAGAGRGVGAE